MTEREAGPAEAGPAREQVVIRDKRKIDPSGRPRTEGSAQPAEPSEPDGSATAGQPTGGAGASGAEAKGADQKAEPKADGKADSKKAEPAKGEAPSMGQPGTPMAAGAESTPYSAAAAAEPETVKPLGAELEALRGELDERLNDLQRLSAEYANYRKRVERDRGLMAEQATGAVLVALLPILDDLDRARDHGDLVGPFGAVADQLTAALTKFGLNGFGEVGDRFDPARHEAVTHATKPDITEPTCTMVMRRGYLLGDRLLRPALVAVADPE